MTDTPILLDISGPIARLTMNRPSRLNSLTRPMLTEMHGALGEVSAAKHVRVLVLTGAGRAFCSGQDLADSDALSRPEHAAALLRDHYNPVIRALRALPVPVLAAVNGIAAGAGCSLAMACDIAVATRSASFMMAFSRIGLVPDAGSTYFLPRIVGTARAMGLAMLGEPVPAETAALWGLVLEAVRDEAFAARVEEIAQTLAEKPTRSLALTKRAIFSGETESLDAQLDLEADLQAEAVETDDAREGVAAFLEKRAPVFRGS
ncbi:MAG: enoyl-CoA hydratase-related protein [Dongiaceae bacterium]